MGVEVNRGMSPFWFLFIDCHLDVRRDLMFNMKHYISTPDEKGECMSIRFLTPLCSIRNDKK